jgi:hypothetical protein
VAHPLETVEWRLERANEHLTALKRERDTFLGQKDRRIVGHFERDTSEYVFYLEGKLPDPRIGLIVGEFAHHLRAALDNLLWQLVRLRGGSPTKRTQFPIYERWERDEKREFRRMLRGVSADDRAAIEAVQPFQDGAGASKTQLALLAWLNNVDKHRFLHVGCAIPKTYPRHVVAEYGLLGEWPWQPRSITGVGEVLDVRYVPTMAGHDRTELMRVRIRSCGPHPEMEVEDGATVEVALSDREHALILTDLRLIYGQVVW